MDLISVDPFLSIRDLSDKIGVSFDGIVWLIKKIKNKNRIERVGANKSSFCKALKLGNPQAMQGANGRTVQTLMGHKSQRMILRYTHLGPTHLLNALEGLVRLPLLKSERTPKRTLEKF